MEESEKEYMKDKRLEEVRKALSKLTTERTTTVDGISNLIPQSELGGILHLKPKSVQRVVNRYLKSMGAVVKIGNRNLIHVWGIQRLTNMVGRCPECGRHWNKELALKELEGELQQTTTPFIGTTGLQGGLKHREQMRALGADVEFEDIKPRMSIFGDPRTWEPEEEKKPEPRKWKLGRVS